MHAATRLKALAPVIAERSFRIVSAAWIELLDAEYSNKETDLEVMLGSVVAFLEREFLSPHERDVYQRTVELSQWCCQPPASPAELAQLHEAIDRVSDQDLRSLVLAPVAAAWHRMGDYSRGRAAAEHSTQRALHKAGYLISLRSADDRPEHIVDLLTRPNGQGPSGAIEDLLRAWFRLRLAQSDPQDYATKIEQWAAAN
jgi:hypothetical protein